MMDIRNIILDSILECIYLNIDKNEIKDDTILAGTLGFDSIIYVQVIVTIEEKIGISLTDEVLNINAISTFGDLYKTVEECVNKAVEV
jgi:acyl carrier protein